MFSYSILLSKSSLISALNKEVGLTVDAQRAAMISSENPFKEIGEGLSILQAVNPTMLFDDVSVGNVVDNDSDVVTSAALYTGHDILYQHQTHKSEGVQECKAIHNVGPGKSRDLRETSSKCCLVQQHGERNT